MEKIDFLKRVEFAGLILTLVSTQNGDMYCCSDGGGDGGNVLKLSVQVHTSKSGLAEVVSVDNSSIRIFVSNVIMEKLQNNGEVEISQS